MAISKNRVIENMRIGGRKVDGVEGTIEVINPYTNEIVGTVPRASQNQVQEAFEIAQRYKPTLTRYERQQILSNACRTQQKVQLHRLVFKSHQTASMNQPTK